MSRDCLRAWLIFRLSLGRLFRTRLIAFLIRVLFVTVVFIYCLPTARGVSGISNSKLVVPNTDTVAKGRMEIEPFMGFSTSHKAFGKNWKTSSLTGRNTNYELGLRLTAGVLSNLEMGFQIPFSIATDVTSPGGDITLGYNPKRKFGIGMGDIAFGVKWRFWEKQGFSLAALGGVALPTGEDNPPENRVPTGSGTTVVQTGIVFTGNWGRFSLDKSVVASTDTSSSAADDRYGINVDLGVQYLIGNFHPLIELNYLIEELPLDNAQKLSLSLGFTHELRPWLILVTGLQIDLTGRNTQRHLVYVLAWTFLV